MSKKRPSQSVSRCRLYLSQWEAVRGNIRSAKRQSVREHVEKFCYCIWTCGVARGRQSHQKGKGPACAMSTGCTHKSGFHFQGKHEGGEWHDGICALKSEVSWLGENKGTRGRGGTLSRGSERPQHMGNHKSDKREKVSHFCPCPNKKCQGAKPLASMDYHYSSQTSAPSFTVSFFCWKMAHLLSVYSVLPALLLGSLVLSCSNSNGTMNTHSGAVTRMCETWLWSFWWWDCSSQCNEVSPATGYLLNSL